MKILSKIRFWHLMVGTGFFLLLIGLVMIFLPPGVADSEPFLIEFFEASIEGSEMGLALIVLGLSCFLIGRKDLADLRTTRGIQEELGKNNALTAKLVADKVERTFQGLPARPARLASLPDLDLDQTRLDLKELQNGGMDGVSSARLIQQAERGLELLHALEKEGYSI
jgi:hypothetical protein